MPLENARNSWTPDRGAEKWLRLVLIRTTLVVGLLPSGCALNGRVPYSIQEAQNSDVPGFENIRTNLDGGSDNVLRSWGWFPRNATTPLNDLAISGGGAGGAFAVGVLAAWTKIGSRPQFDVVTGVSVGALIAPYAFLGSSYDQVLIDLYTNGSAEELVDHRPLPAAIFGPSLLRQRPLRDMVERYFTSETMAAIAVEQRKGRRLLVLTTNLDTQRGVVWNLGAIANSGRADALKLLQDVLVASASIPGVFPSVPIVVKSGGRSFSELHSDGGSASQVLTLPEITLAHPRYHERNPADGQNVYVIVNNALMPEFSNTKDRTLPVVARAYSLLIKSQTRSSLMALYGYTRQIGSRFHVASIDTTISYSMLRPFDTNYMRAVYNLGFAETVSGIVWKNKPLFP